MQINAFFNAGRKTKMGTLLLLLLLTYINYCIYLKTERISDDIRLLNWKYKK